GIGLGEDVGGGIEPLGLRQADVLLLDAPDDLGELAHLIRPEDEVEVWHLLEEPRLLLLRHAAAHPDARAPLALEGPIAAEGREELLLALLADRAGVQDHQVGIVRRPGRRPARLRQRLDHAGGVGLVHLAAESMDEDLAQGSRSRAPTGGAPTSGDTGRLLPRQGQEPTSRFVSFRISSTSKGLTRKSQPSSRAIALPSVPALIMRMGGICPDPIRSRSSRTISGPDMIGIMMSRTIRSTLSS